MRALLIVDVQNDFLPGGALPAPKGDEIIPVINALQPRFSLIVATKDWHPPQHYSFASTHHKKPGETIVQKGFVQQLWPDHCIQGTFGAEFPTGLHTDQIEKVFFKGADPLIDSYSAFYDNARLRETGLSKYLQEHGVEQIYISGLVTEYCVKFSALDAAQSGLKTYVVIDACKGIEANSGDVEKAIEEMRAAGVKFIKSSDLLVAPASQS